MEELPEHWYHPAFRFWVVQDTSHGGDPGRVVDDLTASGSNGRTPIYEKLKLPTLDDFVETVKLIEKLFPGKALLFWKQDFLKAFRRIPGTGTLVNAGPSGFGIPLRANWNF